MGTSVAVSLPTDGDGFVSQECPACCKRFKVVFGEGSQRPIGHCPYCGHAGEGCWWTQDQADFLAAVAGQKIAGPCWTISREASTGSAGPETSSRSARRSSMILGRRHRQNWTSQWPSPYSVAAESESSTTGRRRRCTALFAELYRRRLEPSACLGAGLASARPVPA